MHAHRFHSARPLVAGEPISLAGEEAHHITRVLRLGVGERIDLFDGRGREGTGRLESTGRQGVTAIVEDVRTVPPLSPAIHLIVPWMKQPARLDWLLEKASELGVARTTVFGVPAGRSRGREERWQRLSVAAAKQSGQAWVMEIDAHSDTSPWTMTQAALRILLSEKPGTEPLREVLSTSSCDVAVATGPEEGFSPAEEEAAAHGGWRLASLGPMRLRVETAAVAGVSGVLLLLPQV